VTLKDLSEPDRAIAVREFDSAFGEMESALWCLSTNCRSALIAHESSPVIEALVWTVRSWWGVQGVRSESKVLIAEALAAQEWSADLFSEYVGPPSEAIEFACDRVSDLVARSMLLGVRRREFSLASKVLHWLLPWRIPVYDSFVRSYLKIPAGWDHPDAYQKIAAEQFAAAAQLADSSAAWLGSTEPKSYLRAIDKCLWWLGGGNKGNAMIVRDPWAGVRRLGLRAG
jgi:hypothetical protein